MKAMLLKVLCGVILSVVVCMVCVLKFNNEPKKIINCYTVGNDKESTLPQAQEDRQYLITSYDKLRDFEDEFNTDLSKVITKSTFKDNIILILVSSEPTSDVSCVLSSLYIDENNEPHMLIDKKDSNKDNTSWYFLATVNKDYSKKLNLERWTILNKKSS